MSLAYRFSPALAALVIAVLALAVLASALPRGASATEFSVTNTNDSGPGSLRQAIIDANSSGVADTINFDILACPPACTISPASALPTITGAGTVIDGTSEPQYAGTPLIVIDGSGAGATATGLHMAGVYGAVRALAVTDFEDGIVLLADGASADGNHVFDMEASGIIANGIEVTIVDNLVEGTGSIGINIPFSPGIPAGSVEGNVVTGAGGHGIVIGGDGAVVSGNTVSGSADAGIYSLSGGDGLLIEGNEVSGNGSGISVSLTVSWVRDNTVTGNGSNGIQISGPGNTVSGNVVTGNALAGDGAAGIADFGFETSLVGNEVSGNGGHGVLAGGIGATVGGVGPGEANTITGNGGAGIFVPWFGGGSAQPSGFDPEPQDNTFSANSITGNGDLGIDLAPEGVSPNDLMDPDGEANRGQNFPVLASATTGDSLTVTGSLNSRPEVQFHVEFFANDACDDPSGQGEGEEYLGAGDVTTDVQGNATINVVLPVDVASGRFITATATHVANGDTSEFSNCVEVDATGGTPTPTPTPEPGTPTPTPEPSATATPGGEAKSGDVDCDEDVDSVDALKVLRDVAGLPVDQEEPCRDIGSEVVSLFGDVDCDEDVDSVDSLRILRYVAGLPNDLPDGCPLIGV